MSNPKWSGIQKDFNEAVMHFKMSQQIFDENKFEEDGIVGYRAKMAFMHSMQIGYRRIEDGIKRILRALSENVNDGINYRTDLLKVAATPMENVRPVIISERTRELALELLRFSRIAEFEYDQFDHRKIGNSIEAAAEISKILVDEINHFEIHFNPIKLIDKVRANKEKVHKIVADNGACNPRVFGSAARGEDHEESDLDILVDSVRGETSLISMVKIQEEISILIGVKVEVFTPDCLKEYIREEALKDAVPV